MLQAQIDEGCQLISDAPEGSDHIPADFDTGIKSNCKWNDIGEIRGE